MPLKSQSGVLALAIVLVACAVALHAAQSQRTRSPHGNLEIACQNCHASESWKPVRAVLEFDHNRQTQYPLLGAHKKVTCATCHVTPVFREAAQSCSSCHADIHRRQFGSSCEGCHTVQGWRIQPESIRYHANRFPLAGAHAAATCESCHRGAASATFVGLSTACVSCHASEYASARAIDHRAAGFSTRCEGCHTMSRWSNPGSQSLFNHSASTSFPLTGVHASTSCTQCHAGNRFAGTPKDCASCHINRYNATTAPNHAAAGFSSNCAMCHGTSGWTPSAFDHSRTQFPLLGAHTTAACTSCHTSGRFAGTPTTCVSCHLAAYTATTNPNHVAAAFPQDCQVCHSSVRWLGATFNHSNTRFPLTGAHTSVQCSNCHVANKYSGTPTACYACHTTEFATVANPNHTAAGFPTTCESCHTTTTWSGARVSHKFPIYSGAHAGKWTTCNDCHTTSSNYTLFSCTNCHAHDRTTMDAKHRGRTGYVYESLSCYGCHPNGTH